MDDIREIIAREVNLLDVVQTELGEQLVPSGVSEYRGLCPFHEETTPSFFVNPEKGKYHCFGCEAGGDVITFIRTLYGKSFWEAVEYIVERYAPHINLEKFKRKQHLSSARELLKELLKMPPSRKALMYLTRERGIPIKLARALKIIAFNKKDLLRLRHIDQLRIPLRKISDHGLMFPVFGPDKFLAGFIVRNIEYGEGVPKYINSRGLKKEATPYLSHIAFKNLRKQEGSLYIAEGIFDAIKIIMAGKKTVIASQGTTLPADFILNTLRYFDGVFVYFDKDEAGKKATRASVGFFINYHRKVFYWPSGSYFGEKDIGALKDVSRIRAILENSVDYIEHLKSAIARAKDLEAALRLQDIVYNISSHIKSEPIKKAFLKSMGIKERELQNARARKNKHIIPILEPFRKIVYNFLRAQGREEARYFEPASYEETMDINGETREYLIIETKKWLDGAPSLLEFLQEHKLYELKRDRELFAVIINKLKRRESLVYTKSARGE